MCMTCRSRARPRTTGVIDSFLALFCKKEQRFFLEKEAKTSARFRFIT
jgi:hypothetical protein